MKLLLSNDLTADSRVLYHRGIRERLGKVAPFLHFDGDPYLVIFEGRLFWINDAYTVSDRYPYSQRLGVAPTTFATPSRPWWTPTTAMSRCTSPTNGIR